MAESDGSPLGWSLYFLGKKYIEVLDEKPFLSSIIDLGYELLQESGAFDNNDSSSFLDSTKAIEINYELLQEKLESEGFGDVLASESETTIRALGLAAYKVNFNCLFILITINIIILVS